ncbi:hypothetical protein EV424DRAFT_1582458 [Suillus variegatus]|nr:hypothetical protein EV424DRAFT_1582458 [Suillus variegatus]
MANTHQKAAAARARAARLARKAPTHPPRVISPVLSLPASVTVESESESESECEYEGGVNHILSEPDLHAAEPCDNERMSDTDESLEELEGTDLEENLKALRVDVGSGGYAKVAAPKTVKTWQKAEKNQALGYTGTSKRTQQCHAKQAHESAQKSNNPQILMMRQMFVIDKSANRATMLSPSPPPATANAAVVPESGKTFFGYISDLSSDSESDADIEDSDINSPDTNDDNKTMPTGDGWLPRVPPRKRQRLDVPRRVQQEHKREYWSKEMNKALGDMDKLLKSKKTQFIGGPRGLQARRTQAIQSHLKLVATNGRTFLDASERAAEAHGFAAKQGHHAKVYLLLSDPAIASELRLYVRSNKWVMDPEKLTRFTENQLIPSAADKYLQEIVHDEMPRGLKRYMEDELFPRIHLKAGRSISLSTARQWLHSEGFQYTSHKKGLYFNGHDCPDVVSYRQDHFLPFMKSCESRLVCFVVGDVDEELVAAPDNYVERWLVLVAHDEMTAQANDSKEKSWVFEDQHALRKKGVGRGIHQSDVICSTIGHLVEASQTLEYGKNYNGYWTGELFVKQLKEKIIPAFENTHGPGYQALFMVDNSQGHSAYSEDALLVSRMNVKPGGKQAHMRDGWFMRDGIKVIQQMVYPPDHPEFPNELKGMKAVLAERGLSQQRLRGKCKKCESDSLACCYKRILELQADFQEQKSLVQENYFI